MSAQIFVAVLGKTKLRYNMIMKHRGYLPFVLALLLTGFVAVPASAACVTVTRTLSLGSSGKEVLLLQRFLNNDTTTQIAMLGKNSPGEENGIFDTATSRAVKAFQLKNKSMILTPAGMTKPNGVVGKYTRDLIRQMLCGVTTSNRFFIASSTPVTAIPSAQVLADQKKLADLTARANDIIAQSGARIDAKLAALGTKTAEIQDKIDNIDKKLAEQEVESRLINTLSSGDASALSPASSGDFGKADPLRLVLFSSLVVHRGEKLALAGTGFLAKNAVHFGDQVLDSGTPNAAGTVLYVTVPQNAASGKVEVFVENTKGKSASRTVTVIDGMIPPSISTIVPSSPGIGALVTLKGDHFSAQNDIMTSFGPIRGVTSLDGKTLRFKLSPDTLSLLDTNTLKSLPLSIGVSNDNGMSNIITIPSR